MPMDARHQGCAAAATDDDDDDDDANLHVTQRSQNTFFKNIQQ